MNTSFSSASAHAYDGDLLVVGATPEFRSELASLDAAFDGNLVAWLERDGFKGTKGATCLIPTLGRIPAARLLIVGVGDGSPTSLFEAAGTAGRSARNAKAESVGVAFPGADSALSLILEGLHAGNYTWEQFMNEERMKPAIADLTLFATDDQAAVDAAGHRAAGQAWARDLVNLPAADLYPETLADEARGLASHDHVEVEVWDFERCRAEGCVGIIAVGQGSTRPGCLIRIRYAPPNAVGHIALVGKGVTFDAGGLSLKPTPYMQTMRCDMGGAAVVLGTMKSVIGLGLPIAVDCFVGAVENMTGGDAYKLGDILKYRNGVTVEIHNTDAEGRLVLADCLINACATEGVTHVVDAATLTGASVVALGPDFSGLFTSDDAMADSLLEHAEDNAEGLWRLPLHAGYKKMLKSEFAQIKNVGGRHAGATTAALFLEHFVSDHVTWAHLDVAGPAFHDTTRGFYSAGGTGQMVRSLTSWIASLG